MRKRVKSCFNDFRRVFQLLAACVSPVQLGHQGGDFPLGLLHLRLKGPGGQPQSPMAQDDQLLPAVTRTRWFLPRS